GSRRPADRSRVPGAPLAVGRFRAAVVVGSAGTEGAARGSGVTRLVVTQPGAMRLVMMRPGIVRDLPVGFRSAPGVPNADRDPRGRFRSDDATTRRRHDATTPRCDDATTPRRHDATRRKGAKLPSGTS